MARRKKSTPSTSAAEIPDALRHHLPRLGLRTPSQYLAWCRTHGFPTSLRKSTITLRAEEAIVQRRLGCIALERARRARKPAAVLGAVCRGELPPDEAGTRALVRAAQRVAQIPRGRPHRAELPHLIQSVAKRSRLLLERCHVGSETYDYLAALIALNERREAWIRTPETFRARSHNPRRQFTELVQHLVARYPVPPVLEQGWLRRDAGSRRLQDWYLHAAAGGSLHSARTPIPLTRRMGHHLQVTPGAMRIERALRWAQVRALGGRSALAATIADSAVGATLTNDAFWRSVFLWLIDRPSVPLPWVTPILEFVRYQKFDTLEVVQQDASVKRYPPPAPDFTLKGRSFARLKERIRRWQQFVAVIHVGAAEWDLSSIRPLHMETVHAGTRRVWTIRQLASRRALVEEGSRLGHCVATYASYCKQGRCSVWSLEVTEDKRTRCLQTIQVNRHGCIVQVRGRHNTRPSRAVLGVVQAWAEQEDLTISRHVP